MSMDLTGITNKNEYYTNHYFATVFEENAGDTISAWNTASKDSEEVSTPWSKLQRSASQFYAAHDRYMRPYINMSMLADIRAMADMYLEALGYPAAMPEIIPVDDTLSVPVYLEMTKKNGAPLLWIVLSASEETDAGIMESHAFSAEMIDEDVLGNLSNNDFRELSNEELATKVLFGQAEPPRFLMFISMNQIALIDRNKWNEKRYLQFELEEIFARRERTTLQAMSVLLHCESLCPDDGKILLDELDEQSHKNASGVSQDLKYALRESIELLGNEVLYDMSHRQGRDLESDPVDAGQLTIECLRYMYRMLFVLFIEARPELGYAPIKAQSYYSGYSLESLRDIADGIRDDVEEVGGGYYLHETLAKLYDLIYNGYPKTEEELKEATSADSIHDMFLVAPLKAHIFDPEYTRMITTAKLRNRCMLRIIDLMSLTRPSGRGNNRRQRISYANLGINQMGAVYEALLSYRGFIAEQDLYEVKRAGDSFNELDVGYFVPENELDQYTEDERVRYESGEKRGKLRMYKKGEFIYRLAGREREKSASYYTPEVLTKCLVKYALKELLEGKTADEILELTICEPAMGSAAFLNEAINQLAEAYITRKEQETGEVIGYENRFNELQKVKMYIADRNVYGIDLNPVAVELAEVSLWLNTIHEGGYVPWFGTQLVNGNSLIGARRQCYTAAQLTTTSKGLKWYENAPERVPLGTKRKYEGKGIKESARQIYHFLLGDPGMCNYTDKVIKSLEPDNIKLMKDWNKEFNKPYKPSEIQTLLRLSKTIDELWDAQIELRKEVEQKTQDNISVFGHDDDSVDSHTTIRQKDKILSEVYKSEHMRNAGPYARLKFAMDYWCSLWFWPIDKADLLPTRSEFFFDMSLILEGTMQAVDNKTNVQLSLFPTEIEELASDIVGTYGSDSVVDIPKLRAENERIDLAYRIAEQNHFMHWELEFADLFVGRDGFDLIVGNPPWVNVEWNEKNVLSDLHPRFAIKQLTATQTTNERSEALNSYSTRDIYMSEYSNLAGQQNFINSVQNYMLLRGHRSNLYKCFLPQGWEYIGNEGVCAYVHPKGVFEDAKGELLRSNLNTRARKVFRFSNAEGLFHDVHRQTDFALCIYGNRQRANFDMICSLTNPVQIDEIYSKDDNTTQKSDRVIHIDSRILKIFSEMLDGNDDWEKAKLPDIGYNSMINVLTKFANSPKKLAQMQDEVFYSDFWNETIDQEEGFIHAVQKGNTSICSFPESLSKTIYSAANIGSLNPCGFSTKAEYRVSSDYDRVDLTIIPEDYIVRCRYSPGVLEPIYHEAIPESPWGKITDFYRIVSREFVGCDNERTLTCAIAPREIAHVHAVFSACIKNYMDMVCLAGCEASVPYDFFIKCIGKRHINQSTYKLLPVFDSHIHPEIVIRCLMMNCVTIHFKDLWKQCWQDCYLDDSWSKEDRRLDNNHFSILDREWKKCFALRTDYERRQALVELDVLTAMALGMTLDELKNIYKIKFPTMIANEADTWYDSNGRIVFTRSATLKNVGFSRSEFEGVGMCKPTHKGNSSWDGVMKHAPSGYSFVRTIVDDTMPSGPVERTIEYVAPFDRCDREQDYEIAWKFFEEKSGKKC